MDEATRAYYDARAQEYDEWYLGAGRFASRERPDWEAEVGEIVAVLRALEPRRTLDIGCGTGFLTQHLRGFVVGLDQSPAMAAIAQERMPQGLVVIGDGLEPPFADGAFERVVAGHFYGHLEDADRERFLAQARRLADELVIVDSALRDEVDAEEWQERVLNDGSRHRVYKRHFEPAELTAELGGGDVLHAGGYFVIVSAS